MGRIIAAQFITVDGVVEDPDGSDGTAFGGWAFRHGREAVAGDKFDYGPILRTGVFLFGRRTWEHFSTLWPARSDEFATALNGAEKAVVSTCPDLDLGRWSNTRRVAGDVVDWGRRAAADRDVVIIGSTSVIDRFMAQDAVDEYRLRVFPTVTGEGRRLFTHPVALRLTGVTQKGPTHLAVYTRVR